MSDGDKKPGLRDISDLKARLGMLNKNVGAPAAPTPAPAPTSDETSQTSLTPEAEQAMLGGATAVVRIDAPAAEPAAPTPSAPPAAAPAPKAPAAPAPAPIDFGEDLFKKKEEPAVPSTPPSRAAPAADPAAAFQQSAPAAPAPAPQPEAGFAHPLQRGHYQEAAAPVDLSAAEQAALAEFEGKQQGVKMSLALTMTIVAALICFVFGFGIGDVRMQRRTINARIDVSKMAKDAMSEPLAQYTRLHNAFGAMFRDPKKVNWEAIEALPTELPAIDGARILSTRPPLSKELVGLLARGITDLNRLFELVTTHRQLTLVRDKAELEGLENSSEFFANRYFAVMYEPLPAETKPIDYRPPKGAVVAVVGKPEPNEAQDDNMIPIKSRTGKEKSVSLTTLVLIDKNDMLSTKENAQTLYEKRVEEIKALTKKIETYSKLLQDTLNSEAGASKVFSI